MSENITNRSVAVLVLAVALAMAFVPVQFSADTDADTITTVTLVDQNGDEITTPLFNSTLGFDTVDNEGTPEYSLPVKKISGEAPAFLRIGASSGTFKLTVAAEGSFGVLEQTGFTVLLQDGTIQYHAVLTADDEYTALLTDEDGNDVYLEPGKDYPLTIYTASPYQSTASPEASGSIDLHFGIDAVGTRTITFYSDGEVLDTRTYAVGDVIGSFPEVSKRGYELDGWICGTAYVNERTAVSDLTSDTITAQWSKIKPEPEPQPIIHTDTETIVNEDGSITEKETVEIIYPDGTRTV